MRHEALLGVVLLAAACGGRVHESTLPSISYTCGEDSVVRDSHGVFSSHESKQLGMGWRDDEGDHFVEWPRRTTTMEALEYVMPADRHSDAIARVYDTSQGGSRVDWRLKHKTVCTATGGYSDALARYVNGASFDEVAKDLSLPGRSAARDLIQRALRKVQKRLHTAERQVGSLRRWGARAARSWWWSRVPLGVGDSGCPAERRVRGGGLARRSVSG